MTKKIQWRLKSLPTTGELRELVKDKIITNEEAREILFNQEDEEERDKKGLESEIKFLRELVEKLSRSRSEIVTTIREIQVPYYKQPWYAPYTVWCSTADAGGGDTYTTTAATALNSLTGGQTLGSSDNTLNAFYTSSGQSGTAGNTTAPFSSINTF